MKALLAWAEREQWPLLVAFIVLLLVCGWIDMNGIG